MECSMGGHGCFLAMLFVCSSRWEYCCVVGVRDHVIVNTEARVEHARHGFGRRVWLAVSLGVHVRSTQLFSEEWKTDAVPLVRLNNSERNNFPFPQIVCDRALQRNGVFKPPLRERGQCESERTCPDGR